MTLTLEPITRDNWRAALAVRVAPQKQAWVSSVSPVAAMILAKSFVRPDGQVWHPLAMVQRAGDAAEGAADAADRSAAPGTVVGVLAVGVDPGDAADARTAWLHHVLVDEDHQGRGHGRAAIRALAAWLADGFPALERVGLCVLPDNAVAWDLYRSAGFEEVGVTVDGQRILLADPGDLAR